MAYLCRRVGGRECDCCMECVGGAQAECPFCGSTLWEVRYRREGEIIGCSECITAEEE